MMASCSGQTGAWLTVRMDAMLCSCMVSDRLPLMRVATYEILDTATVEAAQLLVMTAARSLQAGHDPHQQQQPLPALNTELTALSVNAQCSQQESWQPTPFDVIGMRCSVIMSSPLPRCRGEAIAQQVSGEAPNYTLFMG